MRGITSRSRLARSKTQNATCRFRCCSVPAALSFLYLLANVAYLVTLRFEDIQKVPSDRVGSATADVIFPGAGAVIMAVAIMISTFGCNNGLILSGARAYYAMAKDGLFFKIGGEAEQISRSGVGDRCSGHLVAYFTFCREL